MVLRPGWFPENTPGQQIVFDQIFQIIEKNYKQFGYTHIHTPAVEANKVLLAKNGEDAGKQIFWLYGLAQGNEDTKDYSLHFDLTVPFARYILDRENELTFPFKRYQIQPSWRGERNQRGRFKEFFQADIDVIRRDEPGKDYTYYDAEVIFDLWKTVIDILKFIWISETPLVQINNRKVIVNLLQEMFWSPDMAYKVMNLVDRLDKIWKENFELSLTDLWISKGKIKELYSFLDMDITVDSIDGLKKLSQNPEFLKWVEELKTVISYLEIFKKSFGVDINCKVDTKIIRWLDYYTWTVFEFVLENDKWLGTVCGWGRFDNLTGHIDPKKKNYSWVGWSIGLSRLAFKIFEKGLVNADQKTISDCLFLHFDKTFGDIAKLASAFTQEWKNIEIYPIADKLDKQFSYADKKWIPHVVILGSEEKEKWVYKIKNMKSWNEEEISL